jgi:hypothetical protein
VAAIGPSSSPVRRSDTERMGYFLRQPVELPRGLGTPIPGPMWFHCWGCRPGSDYASSIAGAAAASEVVGRKR